MTKTKILVASGTLVLAIAGFFASHATKRFSRATSAFFKTAGASVVTYFKGASTSLLTTSKNVGHTAFYRTEGSTALHTLFGVKSGTSLSKTLFSIL